MRALLPPAVVVVVVQVIAALALPTLWTGSFGPGATPEPATDLPTAYVGLGLYGAAGAGAAAWLAAAAARRAPAWLATLLVVGLALPTATVACFVLYFLLACAGLV
ncbi:MAG: hypothetical protein H6706_09675 [Myxococcales bacterium]|nr:hypothetical protein [Myxococcales bacterium]